MTRNAIASKTEKDSGPDRPPMALSAFRRSLGVNAVTLWRWRKKGILKTVNIYGKEYVPAEEVANFNRRAANGEFKKQIVIPKPRRNRK